MIRDNWIKSSDKLPVKGTLVCIKVRKGDCTCRGYEEKNSYYEDSFYGVSNQRRVDYWKPKVLTDI